MLMSAVAEDALSKSRFISAPRYRAWFEHDQLRHALKRHKLLDAASAIRKMR